MKKHEIIFSIIKIPLDFFIVFFVFFLARDIRKYTDLIPWVQLKIHTINDKNLFWFAFFWAILYVIIFALHRLYSIKITNSKIKEILQIIRFSIYWFFFYSAFVYFAKDFLYVSQIPRLIILFSLILSIFFVSLSRIFLNFIQNFLIKKEFLEKRKILLITNQNLKDIKDIIKDIKKSKIYKIAWIANKKVEKNKYNSIEWLEKIKKFLQNKKTDEILFINSDFSKKELYEIWENSKIYNIRYRYIPNSFDITKSNSSLTLINKIPVIELKNTLLDWWSRVNKRIFDIIFSFFAIIFLAPFLFIIWILIKLENFKAPAIYKNRRVWQNWKEFNLYKFRYLKWKYCIKDAYNKEKNDEALEYEKKLIKTQSKRKWPLYKIKNDPRKTKIWNFIEKYSIDELPQLFNVLIWNMSIVWPRPHQPREVEKYKENHKIVLTIKPWITWMAQVNWRENNDFDKEVELDTFYIENWTMLLDLKIILKTIFTILKR